MICNRCGQEKADTTPFCEHCGAPSEVQPQQNPAPVEMKKPENVVTGTVGAILGALIGAACIILLSQMNFVASISGIVLAVCTTKGYELLGNQMSKKGFVICILLMLVTPYIADRLDWAIILMQDAEAAGLNWTFGECFHAIPSLLEDGTIEAESYWINLGLLYLFTAIGVVSNLKGVFNKKQ